MYQFYLNENATLLFSLEGLIYIISIVITVWWIFTRNASQNLGEKIRESFMIPNRVIFWLQMGNEVMPSDLHSYIVKVI